MSRKEKFSGSLDEQLQQLQRNIAKQNYNSLEKEEKNGSKQNCLKIILIKKSTENVEIGIGKEENNISGRISPKEEPLTYYSGGSETFYRDFTWENKDNIENRDQWKKFENKCLPFTAIIDHYGEIKERNVSRRTSSKQTIMLRNIDIRDNNINCDRVEHVWISIPEDIKNPEDIKKLKKYKLGQKIQFKAYIKKYPHNFGLSELTEVKRI
jgi:hypothetical protein